MLTQPVLSRIYSRPNWAEVSLSAIRHNFRVLQQHVGPQVTICCVVKCDAYGHGYAECARALSEEGAQWFGVTSTDEGVAMREAGITARVLIMVGGWRGEEEDILHYSLTPALSRVDELDSFAAAVRRLRHANPLPVHLKVDTGMHRLGLPLDQLDRFAEQLRRTPEIELEGIFSHLASSEVLDDPGTAQQILRFNEVLRALASQGLHPRLRHLANTSAAIERPETRHNFIRPGLAIYGHELPPMRHAGTFINATPSLDLRPAMQWKTCVISLRQVDAHQPLGYGGTYITPTAARIAVIASGYGDGYSRRHSNPKPGAPTIASGSPGTNGSTPLDHTSVLIRGQRAPVVGRIAMDMTLVDVSHIVGCEIGDEVALIGRSGSDQITACDVARWSDTLPYEVMCNLSERVLRRYVE